MSLFKELKDDFPNFESIIGYSITTVSTSLYTFLTWGLIFFLLIVFQVILEMFGISSNFIN